MFNQIYPHVSQSFRNVKLAHVLHDNKEVRLSYNYCGGSGGIRTPSPEYQGRGRHLPLLPAGEARPVQLGRGQHGPVSPKVHPTPGPHQRGDPTHHDSLENQL